MLRYIIIFFSVSLSFSQTLNFSIKDEQGQVLPTSNVLFKEKATNTTLEFTKVFDGKKTYTLKKKYASLVIEVQSTSYYSETIELEKPLLDSSYSFDFILKKNTTIQLEDVVIKSVERPYKIKNDTVVFDVKKYLDGTERKVEDLIKKLPGVEVAADGNIKYKGKSIETVTLDGDNLFSGNYRLGTKKINVDMVEQIEAIDNYTNNKLLKGIESDGKVALNLKIKKGKSDFSGSLTNGLGVKNNLNTAFYSDSFLMQISAKMKSFTNINFNNIGRSDAYFYEKQNSKSLDRKSESDFETKKLLQETLFEPQLDRLRTNRNNQFYISHNNLYKLTKRINLKTNINFIDDKIDSEQNIATKNFVNNDTFETNDQFLIVKKVKVFAAEFEVKINTSKSTLLEVFSKQYVEKTKLFSDYIKNNDLGFNNTNETNNFFSINKLVHTWKVASRNALQGNIYYAFNKIPQQFESSNASENLKQNSEFKKSTLLTNYNLIGKTKTLSYTFQIGANFEKTPYLSQNGISNNNSLFLKNSYFNYSRVEFGVKKIIFTPSFSITNYDFNLKNTLLSTSNKQDNLVFEPELKLEYKSGKGNFSVKYSNTQKPISEEFIFTNKVFINNRTTIFNQPSFDFQKSNNYSFNYFYKDFQDRTTFSFSTQYQKSNGQYLAIFLIDENFSTLKNQFFDADNSNLTTNLRFYSYFSKLKTTVVLNPSFQSSNYPNFVNSSDLRKNSNQVFRSSMEVNTGILKNFVFNEEMIFNSIQSKSVITNKVSSFQNTFKITYKIKNNSSVIIKNDLFIPNLKNKSNSYNFIDFEYSYNLKDKVKISLLANNLLNVKSFNQVENNDFSSYTSQTNLIQRYFLVNLDYSF